MQFSFRSMDAHFDIRKRDPGAFRDLLERESFEFREQNCVSVVDRKLLECAVQVLGLVLFDDAVLSR